VALKLKIKWKVQKVGVGGLALYTVRDEMSKDPKGTLKAVADAGYQYIEAAGYDNGIPITGCLLQNSKII